MGEHFSAGHASGASGGGGAYPPLAEVSPRPNIHQSRWILTQKHRFEDIFVPWIFARFTKTKQFRAMDTLNFIKAAIKDYKVGAITASSSYTVKQIMRELGPKHKYIIEYGAGDGVITKAILKILPSDGKLVAVELNRDLLRELRKIKDNRLIVVDEDVVKLSKNFSQFNLPCIDAIISGIPFTFLKPNKRKALIMNTHSALAKDGVFIVYQISPLIFPLLKKRFANVRLRFEPRNLPPYFIMRAEK